MKYLQSYKIFESFDLDTIKDIILDLEDDNFTIVVNPRSRYYYFNDYTEIIITRRVSGHNGGLMGFEFIWRDIKDTIFRLMDYYYSENDKPEINNNKVLSKEKMSINSSFRLFGHIRNGFAASDKMVEFAIGFTSEEDFNNAKDNYIINDYTIFDEIKILIKR